MSRSSIRMVDRDGLPMGVYGVLYYSLRDGGLRRQAGCDSNVSLAYVDRLALQPDEMAIATCQSQPGGVTVYGSDGVRRAHQAEIERTRRETQLTARVAVDAVASITGSLPDGRPVTLSLDAEGYVVSTVECDLAALLRTVPESWLTGAQAARRAILAASEVAR